MKIKLRGHGVIDPIMTGEAGRICGVDRRTFIRWAEKEKVLPVMVGGRAIYERKDVERIAKLIKLDKQRKVTE